MLIILLFYRWNLVDFLSSLSLRNQPLLTRVRRQVAANCPRLPSRDGNLRSHDCKDATLIRHLYLSLLPIPIATYFIYILHLISIDLQLSRLCKPLHYKAYIIASISLLYTL